MKGLIRPVPFASLASSRMVNSRSSSPRGRAYLHRAFIRESLVNSLTVGILRLESETPVRISFDRDCNCFRDSGLLDELGTYQRIAEWEKILEKIEKGEKKIVRLRIIRDAIQEKAETHLYDTFAPYFQDGSKPAPTLSELIHASLNS